MGINLSSSQYNQLIFRVNSPRGALGRKIRSKAIDIDSEYGVAYYSGATLLTKIGQGDSALEDLKMVSYLSNRNIESFANENNVWRSHHLQTENMMESEMQR